MLELDKLEERVSALSRQQLQQSLARYVPEPNWLRIQMSLTQDTMIEHCIESAVACAAVLLYTRFELQHAVTVFSPLAVHINCSLLLLVKAE